ncbi:DUF4915 domain-containing protein [Nostoc edaphicum]|uniref:DUF4915 domain-containing protein n=1 Tax=Nostoc edaphicum TaxID=264686 RepID=UPI0019328D5B|nr:DUF4915 domain-containing protein [Nostoc edaphicum]
MMAHLVVCLINFTVLVCHGWHTSQATSTFTTWNLAEKGCGLSTPTFSALSPDFSFVPRWHPKFISQLVSEDQCHLNGLAMVWN